MAKSPYARRVDILSGRDTLLPVMFVERRAFRSQSDLTEVYAEVEVGFFIPLGRVDGFDQDEAKRESHE
jgi:hypothetical protein